MVTAGEGSITDMTDAIIRFQCGNTCCRGRVGVEKAPQPPHETLHTPRDISQ